MSNNSPESSPVAPNETSPVRDAAAQTEPTLPPTPSAEVPAPESLPAAGSESASAGAGAPSWKPKIQVGERHVVGGRPGNDRRPRGPRPSGDRPPLRPKPRRDGEKGGESQGDDAARGGQSSAGAIVDLPRANVPVPSKREKINPELEAELNAALGDLSLEQVVDQGLVGRALQVVEQESRVRGTVMHVAGDNVFISMGGRNEGVASVRQFKEPPAVGSDIEVVVRSFNAEDGLYELVVPGASIDVSDWSDITQGAVVEARVTATNTGGLECMVNNIRGFIPASQIGLYRVENLGDYANQKLLCVVTEVNPQRKNLVLSHRAVLEREREESRQKLLASLEPGQVHEGVVRKIQDFGAFVDLGGVDGLVHISQLSWDRVKHPSEVIQEGQRIKVKVEKIDAQTGKISLSYRDLLDRPWDNIEQKFPPGTTVKGAVSRLAKFGAFVKLAPGIEGLIHISELAHGRVRRVEDVLKEGQDVEVKVVSVDAEAQRIALSLKATLPPPESAAEKAAEPEAEEPPRPPAVPRKNRPLRGGFDRPTGGAGIGLNW